MNTALDIAFWHWWVAGLLLLALEAFAPGAVFLWMGIAALVTGGVVWLVPGLGWQWAVVLFSALAIISFFAYKRYRPVAKPTDQPNLNRRGVAYIGRRITLDTPIVNGISRGKLDDTQWRISGPDLPAGSTVVVTAVDGATLIVEAV
jgi:inner membrane protein